MSNFLDGPAAGRSFDLQRAPHFIRVVIAADGPPAKRVDVLDLLEDEPRAGDGDEHANDALLALWPFGARGAPVWHMHESIERLQRLAGAWTRVCIGSSGAYADVGSSAWHRRMHQALDALCGNGPVPVWLHMLRGLKLAGSDYPFASADSTSIARNHAGNNTRGAPPRSPRAMADDVDARQCPARWRIDAEQLTLARLRAEAIPGHGDRISATRDASGEPQRGDRVSDLIS